VEHFVVNHPSLCKFSRFNIWRETNRFFVLHFKRRVMRLCSIYIYIWYVNWQIQPLVYISLETSCWILMFISTRGEYAHQTILTSTTYWRICSSSAIYHLICTLTNCNGPCRNTKNSERSTEGQYSNPDRQQYRKKYLVRERHRPHAYIYIYIYIKYARRSEGGGLLYLMWEES
jgi:hypothetical protein